MAYDSEANSVNVANCLLFADVLEKVADEDFYMAGWHTCICGNIVKYLNKGKGYSIEARIAIAAEFLGISIEEGTKLFEPLTGKLSFDPYEIKSHQAAKLMRNLAYTGKVDWFILG